MQGKGAGFGELRRNWWILIPCMAGTMLSAAHAYSLGVMIPVLEGEFGWRRAEISGGLLIVAMIALVGAPLAGVLNDRIGPRPIALFGIFAFPGSLALLSTASADITSWWLLWGLVAVTNMLVLPAIWMKAVSTCFDANRGLALAIALCGAGLAAALVPSLTHALVTALGWRDAYIALGVICTGVVFPLAFVLFRPDRARPAEAGEARAVVTTASGVSAREGFAMPSFIKLAGATMLFACMICVFTTNGVPVLLARGLTPATAAAVAGLIGIGSIVGRLVGGYLLDRFDAGKVAAVSALVPIFSTVLLLATPGSAVTAGVAWLALGLASGAELDCCAYLAARHFGLRSFGTLFGMLNGLMLFGNGASPLLANHVYDVTRSYDPVLWAVIPVCLITALLFLTLGPYPRFAEEEATGTAPAEPRTAPA